VSGPHLGTRVTPFVDGRLAVDVAARAQEHVAACCECAQAVEAERLVKARVASLGVPAVSDDLVARLLDLGGPSGPLLPRDLPMAAPARPAVGVAPPSRADRATRPSAAARPSGRRVSVLRRRPVAAALAGTFSLVGAGIVGVLVLGTPQGAAPPVAEFRTTPSATTSPTGPALTTSPVTPAATASPSGSPTTSPVPPVSPSASPTSLR